MPKNGNRHRKHLPDKCPNAACRKRGVYLRRRENGGADMVCSHCGHVYSNGPLAWPFASGTPTIKADKAPPAAAVKSPDGE